MLFIPKYFARAMHSFVSAIFVQFGPHFAKNISPLKDLFSADPGWAIDARSWGLFQASVTLPCVFFPWLLGHRVDMNVSAKNMLLFGLVTTCVGQTIFIFGAICKSHEFSYMGRFIFGIGEGLTSALSGFMAFRYVTAHKMLAMGLIQSFHSLAIASSKALLIPLASVSGGFIGALVSSLLMCVISLASACMWSPEGQYSQRERLERLSKKRSLSPDFWMVAFMHLLLSSAHRLFGHIDAPFLKKRFGLSLVSSGYMSSVAELVAVVASSLLGAWLDKYCNSHTLPTLLLLSTVAGAFGYAILSFVDSCYISVAAIGLLAIGITNGITPTVLKCVLPATVHESALATAFGVYESSEALGVFTGSLLIGIVAERASDDYTRCVPVFFALLTVAALLSGFLVARRCSRVERSHEEFLPRENSHIAILSA